MAGRIVVKDREKLEQYEGAEVACETVFSVEKHYLGTLCKHGHDFMSTGFSVRYSSMEGCVACAVETGAAKRRKVAEEKALVFENLPEGYLRCPRCEEVLSKDLFHKNKSNSTGHSCYCKPCSRLNGMESRARDPEGTRERSKKALQNRHWSMTLYQGSLSSSKARNLTHSITQQDIKDLWEIQNGLCYWLGIPMSEENTGVRVLNKVSLERINPNIGYEKGNVVLATTFTNLGKSDNSPTDFEYFLDSISIESLILAKQRRHEAYEKFSKES